MVFPRGGSALSFLGTGPRYEEFPRCDRVMRFRGRWRYEVIILRNKRLCNMHVRDGDFIPFSWSLLLRKIMKRIILTEVSLTEYNVVSSF